ncbi:hypothetical protein UPYG_G00058770 [Umbra pygmaea]|uniref:TTF-type domain-containing protein n=1 Tax=Umbra pygmaea TaxID=75934 RepID=A0ABD0XTR5_UMBPY
MSSSSSAQEVGWTNKAGLWLNIVVKEENEEEDVSVKREKEEDLAVKREEKGDVTVEAEDDDVAAVKGEEGALEVKQEQTEITLTLKDEEEKQNSEARITDETGVKAEEISRPIKDLEQAGAPGRTVSDLGDPDTGPKQAKLPQYPFKRFGLQNRAFQHKWFEIFDWLEYSVERNAVFCFSCRIFGKQQIRKKQDALVSLGYTNWKRALESFREHEKTGIHKATMMYWKCYKTSLEYRDIVEEMQAANVSEIQERRQYLRRIVAVTTLLGKLGVPFGGHDEAESSNDQGNFLEIMNLLAEFDPFLQNYKAPSNSIYLSPVSQNEMVQSCSQEITAKIVKELKAAQMFSVMAEEARDGHSEQLAVCVRYVTPEGTLKERFLGLSKLRGFDAESVTEAIEQMLVSNGLENLRCVSQAYNGASVMSGAVGDVQARFRAKHPEAIYVHCYAHELNQVLCYACEAVKEASDFFDTLECMYTFFSASLANHPKFIHVQKLLGLQKSELVKLSKSRWSCQLGSVEATLNNFSAVGECLENISTPMAIGLRAKMRKFPAVYMLLMFHHMLSITSGLHKYLQGETVDLAQAVELKDAVYDTLAAMRTDNTAGGLYDKAKTICEANHIQVPSDGPRNKKKRMDDYVVESSCGQSTELSSAENMKRILFFPCLDRMLKELDRRFSGEGSNLMKGIQACHPGSATFLSEESIAKVSTHYKLQLRSEEIFVAKQYLARKKKAGATPDMLSVYRLLDCDMFPTLKPVFQLALSIPVSSYSCEQSFSALRRLHTWLRSTVDQDRLHHLAVLSIEKDAVGDLEHNVVIDRFAKLKSRRYSLMVPPPEATQTQDKTSRAKFIGVARKEYKMMMSGKTQRQTAKKYNMMAASGKRPTTSSTI